MPYLGILSAQLTIVSQNLQMLEQILIHQELKQVKEVDVRTQIFHIIDGKEERTADVMFFRNQEF